MEIWTTGSFVLNFDSNFSLVFENFCCRNLSRTNPCCLAGGAPFFATFPFPQILILSAVFYFRSSSPFSIRDKLKKKKKKRYYSIRWSHSVRLNFFVDRRARSSIQGV